MTSNYNCNNRENVVSIGSNRLHRAMSYQWEGVPTVMNLIALIQQKVRNRMGTYKMVKNSCGFPKLSVKFCCKALSIILLGSILTCCAQEEVESMVEEGNSINESEIEHTCPVESNDLSSELIGGRWRLVDQSLGVSLTFCADGTGVEFNNSNENVFEWSANDGILVIERMREGEVEIRKWSYSIERSNSNDRDVLQLTNLHNNITNAFYRWVSL